jgi:ElaB/YqjD/DUF883 family membrane-anchored ribosome-binding protein
MPPRDPTLPEGTDHIIDTNIDLGDTGGGSGGGGASGSGGSGATGGAGAAGSGSGGSGSGGGSAFQFDKNGGSGGSGGSSSSASSRASGIAGAVKDQISTLTGQAGERARTLADDGKSQATNFLQTVAQIVADAAGSVEDRLGSQYAGFGQRASSSINSLASTLDQRSVDDLIGDARSFVQRSPAIAIGIAAVAGFAVARVVRSSVAEFSGTAQGATSGGDTGSDTAGTGTGTGTGGTGMARGGASGGLAATSGGFGEQGVGTAGGMGSTGVSTGAGSSGGTGNAPTI